jgi:CRISPR-associated protein Csx10
MELRFCLTLKSDYHVSAGFGLGAQLDSVLLRDADDVLVLRGSTLTGILRDGLWRLLQTTPKLQSHFAPHARAEQEQRAAGESVASAYCREKPVCPLCRIFGSPQRPKRWRIASARPESARKPLKENCLEHIDAQVAARIHVNPRTRRAAARSLFRQEEGDSRLIFHFSVTCDDDDAHEEAALIFAAARMVRRFGSSRRRGRGECELHLVANNGEIDESLEAVLREKFSNTWLQGTPVLPTEAQAREWRKPTATGGEAVRYRLIVRTDEPVVMAARAAAGNMFDCLPYINASTVWGALAREAAVRWRLRKTEDYREGTFYRDNAAYRAFMDVFLRGLMRISPLYPADYKAGLTPSLHLMIPAPFDLLSCKAFPGFKTDNWDTSHHGVYGCATELDILKNCPECKMALTSLGGFLPVKSGSQRLEGVRHRDELHPRINPLTQRAATGDLFGYVALESGQYFIGETTCQDAGTCEALRALTEVLKEKEPFYLRLGKATRRGYGKVSVWVEPIGNSEIDRWRGKTLKERVKDPKAPIRLTLLSDAIVPDAWGRFRQTLNDPAWIEEILNAPFKPNKKFQLEKDDCNNPKVIRTYCKTDYIDGFNNNLGLPRWRDIAFKAGSAVGFRLCPPSDADERNQWFDALINRLQAVEEEGIGLRRNEGFGMIAFNHPVYEGSAGLGDTDLEIPEALRLASAPGSGALATVLSQAACMKEWEEELREINSELFEDERWMAVARWLRTATGHTTDKLKEGLKHFGEASLLTTVKRDKKIFFTREKPKAIAHLERWLDKIGQAKQPDRVQRIMVERLAERLAACVKRE